VRFDAVATGGYIKAMKHVSIKQAKDTFPALVREVEGGARIVITRNGKPVAEVVPHQERGGTNWDALEAWKKDRGVAKLVTYISPDFDDPLPEDFLITPGPS
jgi:prevent-host-death family protein